MPRTAASNLSEPRGLMAAWAAYVTEREPRRSRLTAGARTSGSDLVQRYSHATKPLDQIVLMPNGGFVPDRPCLDTLA